MFYSIVRGVLKFLTLIIYRVKVINVENFNNTNGRCIICCNHISNIDPIILACYTKRQICFMAKKELFNISIIRYLAKKINAFPVDRTGVSVSAIRHAVSILKDDKVLGIFPEGTRVKGYDENNSKAGISMIANMSNSLIVPAFLRAKGKYRPFSKVELIFGDPKNYFEGIEGRITSDMHTEIGKQILKDIYLLENKLN